jgi:hypothetical protein
MHQQWEKERGKAHVHCLQKASFADAAPLIDDTITNTVDNNHSDDVSGQSGSWLFMSILGCISIFIKLRYNG